MNAKEKKVSQLALPRGSSGRIAFVIMNRMHRAIYENVVKILKPQPEDDILDVGCGNGYFLKNFACQAHSIAGIDLSELSVELAIKKNKERVDGRTAEFFQGEASKLPWNDGHFSAVTSMGSFLGFPEPLESLKEMHRVLRPRGRAVISLEWNAEDGLDHAKVVKKHGLKMYTEGEIRNMFKEAGYSDITINYAKGYKMPKIMIARGVK